jgi:cell division protein FtsL
MATAAMAGQGMFSMGSTHSRATRNRELFEQQKRARRGPTPEVFFAKHIDNSRMVKADDPERRREMRSFAATMSILFMLVMIYVWQHLSAIEIGYQIETQKQQVEQMGEENRQLRLAEAQLSDPNRIGQIARMRGMDSPQPGQVVRPEGSGADAADAPVLAQAYAKSLPTE